MNFFVRRRGGVAREPELGDTERIGETEKRSNVFAGADVVGDEVDGTGHRVDGGGFYNFFFPATRFTSPLRDKIPILRRTKSLICSSDGNSSGMVPPICLIVLRTLLPTS